MKLVLLSLTLLSRSQTSTQKEQQGFLFCYLFETLCIEDPSQMIAMKSLYPQFYKGVQKTDNPSSYIISTGEISL